MAVVADAEEDDVEVIEPGRAPLLLEFRGDARRIFQVRAKSKKAMAGRDTPREERLLNHPRVRLRIVDGHASLVHDHPRDRHFRQLFSQQRIERLRCRSAGEADGAGPAVDLLQERSSCRGNELIDGLEDSNVHGVRCQRLDVDAVNR